MTDWLKQVALNRQRDQRIALSRSLKAKKRKGKKAGKAKHKSKAKHTPTLEADRMPLNVWSAWTPMLERRLKLKMKKGWPLDMDEQAFVDQVMALTKKTLNRCIVIVDGNSY